MDKKGWMTAEERKDRTFARQCGSCTLCCKLLPVDGLHKANTWCQHAVKGKGCAIYETRPGACRTWACLWLDSDDDLGLRRPDKCHFVVDEGADVIGVNGVQVGCMQVWLDPAYPNAWRDDPALIRLIHRFAQAGYATLLRTGDIRGRTILAPPLAPRWTEHESEFTRSETTLAEKAAALGNPDDPEVREAAERGDHFQWARKRALEHVERGEWSEAVSSLVSDLGKREGYGLSENQLADLMEKLVTGDHESIRTFIREVH